MCVWKLGTQDNEVSQHLLPAFRASYLPEDFEFDNLFRELLTATKSTADFIHRAIRDLALGVIDIHC